MSNDFRTTGHDIAPPPPKKHEEKPGTLPDNRIPVFDYRGHRRGHVGRLAGPETVARFTGQHGAKLGTKDGRTAWISPPPPKGPTHGNESDARHAEHLRSAKGSVTHSPSAPKTAARPKRGH